MRNSTRPDILNIADVMTTEIVTTSPDSPVEEVANDLRNHGYSGLPVVDADGRPMGLIDVTDVVGLFPEMDARDGQCASKPEYRVFPELNAG